MKAPLPLCVFGLLFLTCAFVTDTSANMNLHTQLISLNQKVNARMPGSCFFLYKTFIAT